MRAVLVTADYPPKPMGGIARSMHDLARGFAAAGHDTWVVTRDDVGGYRESVEDGVQVVRFGVRGRWIPELSGHPLEAQLSHAAAVRSAVERIHARAPVDVVGGSLWTAEALLCALDPRWPTRVWEVTSMETVASLEAATAAAPGTQEQIRLERALLASPASIAPPRWGVEDLRDRYPRRRADDGVEILFVGRLEQRKGIDVLLPAAADVLRAHPDARLRLVGGDNPIANGRPLAWQAWVREHAADVADRVVFSGHVSDDELYAAYADCDVFCAPSRYESFGLVHVEGMMMGRPVIGCDAGGMRGTVVDGETGYLVPPGDEAALRAALERLVTDADLRARMGAAARARYEAAFTMPAVVARVADELAGLERPTVPIEASLPQVLAELGAPATAAAPLLDPWRFPDDRELDLRLAFRDEDEAFVTYLYRAALGRAPGLPELAQAVADLNARRVTRPDLAASLITDPVLRAKLPEIAGILDEATMRERFHAVMEAADEPFVDALYELLLGRSPDPVGRGMYVGGLRGGRTRAEITAEIATSLEAHKRGIDPRVVARLPLTG